MDRLPQGPLSAEHPAAIGRAFQSGRIPGHGMSRALAGVALILTVMGCVTDNCISGDCQTTSVEQTTMKTPGSDTPIKVAFKNDPDTPAEKITELGYDGKQVTATVISHGCTHQDQFVVEHTLHENQCYATVVRTKPDLCKRAPIAVEISIPWTRPAECEGSTITFTNPLLEPKSNTFSKKLLK